MTVRVHHLNVGTMRPPARRLVNGDGRLTEAGRLVCHCLLVETDRGLVLVDTGFGLADVADPRASLGDGFLRRVRPLLDPGETAGRQVVRLGYTVEDVRHVVLTHLDPDHAGGLRDFPHAKVHVYGPELRAALSPAARGERRRYRAPQWSHGPDWAPHEATGGESWFGFGAVRQLDGLPPEVLLVPLGGHTRGHAGVAVDRGGGGRPRWLLHAGDAYFHRGEIDPAVTHATPGLRLFAAAVQAEGAVRRRNQARLRELAAGHGGEVTVFCAHDPVEFQRLAAARAGT